MRSSTATRAISSSSALMAMPSRLLSAHAPALGVLQQIMCLSSILKSFTLDELLSSACVFVVLLGTAASIITDTPLLAIIPASVANLVSALLKMHTAYHEFMTLAPGSLPRTLDGFIRANKIARRAHVVLETGHLCSLSLRPGSTPFVSNDAPQRQINQESPEEIQIYLNDRLALFAASQTTTVAVSQSQPCGCASGLYLRTFGCSFCSPVDTVGNTHVILHPTDLEKVIAAGWGEVHPNARTDSYFAPRSSSLMPATLALIYAPRGYNEVCTVMSIVEAGAKFLASVE